MIFWDIFRIIVFTSIIRNVTFAQSDSTCNNTMTADLRDDQFTASSVYRDTNNASAARNSGNGWSASSGGSFEYLKLDLESVWKITSMDVRGSNIGWYPRTFRVSYSMDGYVWTGYNTRLSDDRLGELFERKGSVTEVTFDPEIKARYLAINPVTNYGYAALRIELYGCQTTDSSSNVFTKVSNDIEVDTTWISSQSPILIDGSVDIRSSAVLTVQAGVSVIFTSDTAGMNVYGSLSVDGISGLAATFSSNHPVLSLGSKWRGVFQGAGGNITMRDTLIRQAETGVQGNGSRVKLVNSEIHSCEYGIRLSGGIERNISSLDMLMESDVILSGVYVHDNVNGLYVHADISKPDVPMEYSNFERNKGSGVIVINWDKTNVKSIKTNLYVINCSMSNNTNYGLVSSERILSNFYISNSSFVGNRQTGIYYYRYYRYYPSIAKETLNVSNSDFIENRYDGIQIYCYNCEPGTHFYQNNIFSGHTRQAMDITLTMRSSGKTTNITISKNSFERNLEDIKMRLQKYGRVFIQNNYFAKSRIPVKLNGGGDNTDIARMIGNVFTDHTSVYDDSVIEIDGISTSIINSTFANSSIQTLVQFNNGFSHSFEYNRFLDTSLTSCYVRLMQGYNPNEALNIDNNYWGTADMLAIKTKICDFFLDSNRAVANLSTFFSSITLATLTSASGIDDFRFKKDADLNATIIGGILRNRLDLATLADDRFIVNRSILITQSASLNISDATLSFTKSRGITAHGTLRVNNGNDDSGRTILQSHNDGPWNGINLYSEDIAISNMDLFGTQRLLFVHGINTSIILHHCKMSDDVLQNLIYADMVNGNLSVSIRNSSVKSRSSAVYIKANDSRNLDLEMIGSQFSSFSYVVQLAESTLRRDLRHVKVNISNCSMYSNTNRIVSLLSCSSHITGTISRSNFSSYRRYGTASFQSSSMAIDISGNNFGDGADILHFRFCNRRDETTIYPRVINITRNNFNSSVSGKDITIYTYYTDEESHRINVSNNLFGYKDPTTRGRIDCYGYGYSSKDKHFLVVDSNLFANSTGRVIGVTHGLQKIIINNNTFANNSQCIYISNQQAMDDVNITKNEFMNNTFTDGVIYLDKIINNNTNIISNSFFNNTDTAIAFRPPDMTIRYNFFENGNDVYNLLVLPRNNYDYTYSGKIVNASLNFWGTTDIKEIAKTIYDKDYDDALIDIVFRPYLGSRNTTDIQNEDISFVSPDGEIGGSVNGNVSLEIDRSPYLVVSNVDVEESDTLTIEAGVVLLVKANVGFKVTGRINILGSEEKPVKLLPEVLGKAWRGIDLGSIEESYIRFLFINDTQEGVQITSPMVNIHNITSTFARQSGITIDVPGEKEFGRTELKISEVNVENNVWDGIHVISASGLLTKFRVEKCFIANNTRHGLNVETSAEVEFENCIISNNSKSGVHLEQSGSGILFINKSVITNNSNNAVSGKFSGGIVINSCSITNHSNGYFNYWGTWYSNSYIDLTTVTGTDVVSIVEFTDTNFTGNIGDGISISNSYYGNRKININIEKCIFAAGNRTLVIQDSQYSWNKNNHIDFKFVNNIVEKNTYIYRRNDQPLFKLDVDKSYGVEMTGNIFKNNNCTTGLHLSILNPRVISNGNITISENRFLENNFSLSTIDVKSHLNLKLHQNIFQPLVDPDCILVAPTFDISYAINASYNYWGSPSGRTVVEKVCSFEKDMSRSYAWYIPFYEDEKLTHAVSSQQNTLNVSGAFGGEITDEVTLSKRDFPSPVQIYRSFMIREGASLNVEAGVVLQFESNRGIYAQGSLKLLGGDTSILLENTLKAPQWYGVMINTSSQANEEKTVIYNTKLKKTIHGVVLYSSNAEIKGSQIKNSTNHCLTIYQSSQQQIYDFELSGLANCNDHGVYIVGDGLTTLMNIAITVSRVGIGLTPGYGSVDIRSVNISESREDAVYVSFSDRRRSGNVTVEGCSFLSCLKGVTISSQNYFDYNNIRISRNTFTKIAAKSLSMTFPSYRYYYANNAVNRTVTINLNTFNNSCGVSLESWNNVNLTFHDNIVTDARCVDGTECFFQAFANGNNAYNVKRHFDISTNMFQNITCNCLVQLKDKSLPNLLGTYVYNQMLDIKASEAVVFLDALYINVSSNIFDNPDTSFDVYTYKVGSESVNVTKNWWGSSDEDQVYNRIFDKSRDPNLIQFIVDPVLTEREIDCTGVNNCSLQGECVSPNRCRCYSGWTGESCTEYDCSGINDCYGNGDCTGPNTCKCHDGWSGTLCIVASCINVNNCSGQGICVRPNECKCAVKFTGNDCSSCVPLHWGPQCRPCPDCQHGHCNLENGLCECDSENWTGFLCDKCSETFYGPDCEPLIKVLNIVPNQGLDTGGNSVHVWGHNFPNTSQGMYICKFGSKETNGTWLAWNHVICLAPQLPEGMVTLEISPDGVEFTNDKMMYFFYASCPPGSCGRNFNPSRGQCLFGGCSCFLPWAGDNCDEELFAPDIIAPALDQRVEEAESYSLQLILGKGSPPILWSLLNGPPGMTIDERTGLVYWKRAYADSEPYKLEARAKNIIGRDTVTWNLNVPISYSVHAERVEPSGNLPVPRPVKIFGTITFSSVQDQRVVPIDIIVSSARTGRETVIKELSDPLDLTTFMATYYPRPDDAGVFSVSVRHPGASSMTQANVTWSVMGMRCDPSAVSVDKKILSDDGTVIVVGIASLRNVGNSVIEGISGKVDGLPDAFVRSRDTETSQFVIADLTVNDNVDFDLVIRNAKPLSGTVFVIFSTTEGTSTRLKVNIKLSIQKPVLVFDPPSIRKSIIRGNIHLFDIKINNTGEVAAKGVVASLPNDPRLSLVSFTAFGFETASDITIPSGGAALLSIAVKTENTAALGEMTGTIYVNSETTSTPFSYRFYISSLQKFNVTFTVKDEYTYFAAGSPLVNNAKVRLVNPRRGYSETKYTTNETGYVVFENVYEDQYSLYAEAEGHSSYGAVILVTADTSEQDIFLQRVAVKYTWTVEPTTVEDVYVIQLESTFETYVPMPVVTLEPLKVNTIPLELEEIDTIYFTITNHGLIRADNVRFTLPTNHPYLNFKSTMDFIGSVEANTSLIVPVNATLKNRVKRSAAASAVCGLALLYEYVCGGTQTRSIGVTLTREYPGRPPLPCGLGGGQGGGGGGGGGGVYYSGGGFGTGSGSSITYNPTTPLSCDCAKTLIKSCALAYHPIAGCALAVTDLGTSYSRSGGDFVLGTLNAILGLADTAFACVFGVVCSLCGLFYTTIRCVNDVDYYCDGARRRREIGSEVVNNMLTTAKPMDNFLHMMTEILGDEAMYNLETAWYPAFKKTVGEASELGTLLSKDEAATVLESLTEEASRVNLSKFLERWNNTAAAWENGTLTEIEDTRRVISLDRLTPRIEQYLNDVEAAAAKGFNSIFDEFDSATNAYKTAEQQQSTASGGTQKDEGVCARVRVRIVQELVLTRDAFNARLEIENGESADLESIKVEIQIQQTFGTGELSNNKFSIGNPTLIGISGVDGTGTLRKDSSGSAEWLIIPYNNAAPEDDTLYDIGGRLSYSVGGSDFSVPLLPDAITVKPNPSLVVHYFHEKYVRGDDALTPEIEPIVPFNLAVMVMNNGYGIARSLKITSGQPEIIENEKGLLITFKIIGAQLGNDPISPSLAVDFGDISSFQTKTARWLMTSTLMGTFNNYTATFENINPLGDPQLSLLDELGYHELLHLVRIESPDDTLDDFLVNDLVDDEGMPDKLYNSANGTDIADVYIANITHVQVNIFSSAKKYKFVTVTVKTNASMWFYARRENDFTSSDPAMKEHLLHAESANGRALLVDKNVWQTTHIHDMFYLHLFDSAAQHATTEDDIGETELNYVLIYGPRNLYTPRFNASSYSATVSKLRTVGFEIITIDAHDIDKDSIEFQFSKGNITAFNISAISESSAVITVSESPMKPGLVVLEIIAKDSGIPPRSAYMNVTIRVTDTGVTDTTPATTGTDVMSSVSTKETTNATATSPDLQNMTSSTTTGSSPMSSNVTDATISSTTASVTTGQSTTSVVLNTTLSSPTEPTSTEMLNTTKSISVSTSDYSSQTTVSKATNITTNMAVLCIFLMWTIVANKEN